MPKVAAMIHSLNTFENSVVYEPRKRRVTKLFEAVRGSEDRIRHDMEMTKLHRGLSIPIRERSET